MNEQEREISAKLDEARVAEEAGDEDGAERLYDEAAALMQKYGVANEPPLDDEGNP